MLLELATRFVCFQEKELREEGLREIERLKREIAAEDKEIERLNKTIQIWSNK